MSLKTNILISLAVSLLVVVGSFLVFMPKSLPTLGTASDSQFTADIFCYGGLAGGGFATSGLCHSERSGTFNNASTTLFAIRNPFNATSTIDVAILDVRNGTTTIDIFVSTSTTAFAPVDGNLFGSVISQTLIATGTQAFLVNNATLGPSAGSQNGNGSARVVVGPNQFIVGQATSSYPGFSALGLQGITNLNNTFEGSFKVQFIR